MWINLLKYGGNISCIKDNYLSIVSSKIRKKNKKKGVSVV